MDWEVGQLDCTMKHRSMHLSSTLQAQALPLLRHRSLWLRLTKVLMQQATLLLPQATKIGCLLKAPEDAPEHTTRWATV